MSEERRTSGARNDARGDDQRGREDGRDEDVRPRAVRGRRVDELCKGQRAAQIGRMERGQRAREATCVAASARGAEQGRQAVCHEEDQ